MSVQQQPQATVVKKDGPTAQSKARTKAKERELAQDEMRELEAGNVPTDLEGWPSGPAKYLTYGAEDDEPYGEGVTRKLGPADLRRYADGSISIAGEKVDDPDAYKGEPVPAALPMP